MVARTQLAALDHNANTGRQQATVGVQHSQPRTFPKILPANLGLPEQMLLLSLQQDFQTIKMKCTLDYARNADCIKSTLKFN